MPSYGDRYYAGKRTKEGKGGRGGRRGGGGWEGGVGGVLGNVKRPRAPCFTRVFLYIPSNLFLDTAVPRRAGDSWGLL